MRFRSLRVRIWIPLAFLAGVATAYAAQPLYRLAVIELFQDSYGLSVFQCDRAMREHFLAKAQASRAPSDQAVRELDAAQLSLLDCHSYDLERKALIRWGLSENDLATMELRAIEARAINLHRVIETHEIRY